MITRVFQGLLSHVPFMISPGSLSSSRNFWYVQMPESLLTKQPTGSLHELTISNIHWHLQYYHLLISTTVYDTIPPQKKTHDFSFREKNTCINSSECLHIPSLGKKELMTAQWHLPTSPWTYVTLQGTKICHLGKKETYLLKHTVDGQNPANQFVW